MSKLTDNLGLFQYDPETDGANTFNITQALNENWDKIDAAIAPLGGAKTTQEALFALGAGVRPNLLDNPYFMGEDYRECLPINQNGQTDYMEPGITIDRWNLVGASGEVNVSVAAIRFVKTDDTPGYVGLEQKTSLKELYFNLEGKPLTLSCIVDGNCYSTTIDAGWSYSFSKTIEISLYSKRMTLSAELNDKILHVKFYYDESASASSTGFNLMAVKLEVGSTQTLAYYDSSYGTWNLLPQPDSDYITQSLRCQRYMLKPIGYVRSSAQISGSHYFYIPTPARMRVSPVLVGEPTVNSFDNNMAESNLTFYVDAFENHILIQARSQGGSLPDDCYLDFNGAYLSAEL